MKGRGEPAPLRKPLAALVLWAVSAAAATAQAWPHCVADAGTLCLGAGGRFSISAAYQPSPEGPAVLAHATSLTADSGYFWFFDASNIEIVVKVLDGCAAEPGAYWFFAAGLTNVGVNIVVTDLEAGRTRYYSNLWGTPFAPVQDTGAFQTCP